MFFIPKKTRESKERETIYIRKNKWMKQNICKKMIMRFLMKHKIEYKRYSHWWISHWKTWLSPHTTVGGFVGMKKKRQSPTSFKRPARVLSGTCFLSFLFFLLSFCSSQVSRTTNYLQVFFFFFFSFFFLFF